MMLWVEFMPERAYNGRVGDGPLKILHNVSNFCEGNSIYMYRLSIYGGRLCNIKVTMHGKWWIMPKVFQKISHTLVGT